MFFKRYVWLSIGFCNLAGADPDVASWLVDLGRDYPLTAQAGLSDADATLTLLFMEAATRIEPELAVGYFWQADMLAALGRPADATRALAAYVRREPADEAAQLAWIESAVSTLQSAEQRAEFCRAYLGREQLPPAALSELHRRLAEFHWNRAELERARAEAQAALQASPFNLRARVLLAHIQQTSAQPATRVEHYLWALRVNPASAGTAAELAGLLAGLGRFGEAERFYGHATRLTQAVPPGHPPAALLIERAEALLAGGRPDDARKWIDQVIEREPANVDAHLARALVAARQGDQETAKAAAQRVSIQWKQRLSAGQGGLEPRTLATLSWVLVHALDEADQAMALARTLLDDQTAEQVARRALGAALIRKEEWAEAMAALAPVAERDTWSAILLAQAMQKLGQIDAATEQMAALATRPAGAEQRERIGGLAAALKAPPPASRPAAQLEEVLSAFPWEVLEFAFEPGSYLRAGWTLRRERPMGAEPWVCTLTLENTGAFPIHIGREAMLSPEVLCSVQTQGDRARTSGPSLRLLLRGSLQLDPGASISVSQNLLLGPIRAGMIGTPQVTQQVEVVGITNPMRLVDAEGHDVWAPAPGGLVIPPLRLDREGIIATADAVRRLSAASGGSNDVDGRVDATAKLAMLLAEHQHLAAGRLNYAVPRIDAGLVQRAVLARSGDSDWRVRARFAEMSRWFVLDATASQAVTQMLGDSHWLVRGLALRSLADHYPEKSRPVLERMSSADADAWVRRFAGALLQRSRTAVASAQSNAPPNERLNTAPPAPAAPAAPAPAPAEPSSPVPEPAEPPLLIDLPDTPPSTRSAP